MSLIFTKWKMRNSTLFWAKKSKMKKIHLFHPKQLGISSRYMTGEDSAMLIEINQIQIEFLSRLKINLNRFPLL